MQPRAEASEVHTDCIISEREGLPRKEESSLRSAYNSNSSVGVCGTRNMGSGSSNEDETGMEGGRTSQVVVSAFIMKTWDDDDL